ncbi:winged helix-turn-helix domain-containing protein [Dokdonella koreensis]|uniref:Transcriptional regulator n=1 Tax=Dokdonella koreensis DS-123 TaxID=1300342 RepID=A0A167HBQ1_9GAMM|nr:winged helix-turn-helix domain-containing protein [Dokdonella koreensis]ANB19782.1 Putative transcriptional regulator [Dokdonella koreensis DS-123]
MNRRVHHFGECSLDIAARELRRDRVRVDLPPTVFDCIAYLVEHRDRAVGRDELVAAVWGKASVSDTMLGKAILAARRAVGDSAETQALLRTVPRFGYHWVGPVTVEDAVPAPAIAGEAIDLAAPADVPTPVRPSRSDSRRWLLAALVLGLAVVAGLAWLRIRPPEAPPEAPATVARAADGLPGDAIAVLPAEVFATDDDAWLRLGLMDLIATRLRTAGLPVLASDGIVRLVRPGVEGEAAIAAVRVALDVRHLVLPAVRRTGKGWVVHADLIEPDGTRRPLQAEADSAIAAGDTVVERLLGQFGRSVPTPAAAMELSATELVQRIDAARLADDTAGARALIEGAAPALRDLPAVRLRGALVDLRTGRFAEGRAALDALLADVSAETDPVLHARVQDGLCIALNRLGQMDAGLAACDRAIALLETRNQPALLGHTYNDRGVIHARMQRHALAQADFARARIALSLAGDPLLLARVDSNESTLEMAQGRQAEALPIQQRAARQFERFGLIDELMISLANQIGAHLALLQPASALAASDQGWSYLGRVQDRDVRNLFRHQRAGALEENGRLGEARILLDEMIREADASRDWPQRAIAQVSLAGLDLRLGETETALLLARQALPHLPGPEFDRSRATGWRIATQALRVLGRLPEAAEEVRAFRAWAATTGDPMVRLDAMLAEAGQAAAEGRSGEARTLYAQAMDLARQRGAANTAGRVVEAYAGFLLAQGDLAQASTVVGMAARYADVDFDAALLEVRLYHALGRADAWRDALATARRLAGERPIPAALLRAPGSEPALGNGS